jgi:hypothetical protein
LNVFIGIRDSYVGLVEPTWISERSKERKMVGTTLSVLPYAMAGSGVNPDGSMSAQGQNLWNLSGSMVNAVAPFNPMVADLNEQAGTFNLAQLNGPSLAQQASGYSSTIFAPQFSLPATSAAPPVTELYPSIASLFLSPASAPVTSAPVISSAPVATPEPILNTTVSVSVQHEDDNNCGREVNGSGKRPPGWDKGVGNPHRSDNDCDNDHGNHGNQGNHGGHGNKGGH